ncbi:acyl-CoA dehydrogenase [Opitutus sp. ER46]|uniref:acyl-CoA dehydrogenase family protein n=1 Tax=Opitutus sp. ER46 TaxID=2161864 RepID=UPI000D31B483|nr:acyl-CoA dehydrogenase [Opitutus sp. ER46]PTX91219.1 acyl-CoA oxidase [Opitutus sp. ER46]
MSRSPEYPPLAEISSFAPDVLRRYLDGNRAEMRDQLRQLLSQPEFAPVTTEESVADARERTLRWCRTLARAGYSGLFFPPAAGGKGDPEGFFAAGEIMASHDLSLFTKFGVQVGLWGGSILHLGTAAHHAKYLPPTIALELPGCFAMTELGHGSNVREVETTATYDAATQTFTIHSPNYASGKSYIGNAARHGRIATVFAQLIIHGERLGVHAFVVPIRDASGRPLPGITIEDNGLKMGLNGVDNGKLWFDQVRIPRSDMLDRFAQVAPDGTYTSAIENAGARFFAMVATLVGGRIAVGSAAMAAAKTGLTIAVRYAARRRQFGRPGEPEILLLDYPTHQARLLPHLAASYALWFARADLVQRYARGEGDGRTVETMAAAFKAWATDHATTTLQRCREACGAEGFMASSRLPGLKSDSDIFTTFEGDNTVLRQLAARNLLGELQQELRRPGGAGRIAREQAKSWLGWRSLPARWFRRGSVTALEWQRSILAQRARLSLLELGQAIRAGRKRGQDTAAAFLDCQIQAVQAVDAWTEAFLHERFVAGVRACPDAKARAVLTDLCVLFALDRIQAAGAWLTARGFVGASQLAAMQRETLRLYRSIRREAVGLVDAFGLTPEMIGAAIALESTADEAHDEEGARTLSHLVVQ